VSLLLVLVPLQAHVRYVDALYASAKFDEAAAALLEAVAKDATFKSIPEYKVGHTSGNLGVIQLQEHLASSPYCWAGGAG
jgi:hypothetical protein